MNLYLFAFSDGYHSILLSHDKKFKTNKELELFIKDVDHYHYDQLEGLFELGFKKVDCLYHDPDGGY